MTDVLQGFIRETKEDAKEIVARVMQQRATMRERQREARRLQKEEQAERSQQEAKARAARFRRGVLAVWDWMTGTSRRIKRENEILVQEAQMRDAHEREALISKQLEERQLLQRGVHKLKRETSRRMEALRQEVAFYLGMREQEPSRYVEVPALRYRQTPLILPSR